MRLQWIVAAAAITAGCIHGPRLDRLNYAYSVQGARVRVAAPVERTGELVAVTDDGLLLSEHRTNRLVLVANSAVRRLNVEGLGNVRVPLAGQSRDRVRLVSRHPYGVTAEMMAALLERHGQAAVETVP